MRLGVKVWPCCIETSAEAAVVGACSGVGASLRSFLFCGRGKKGGGKEKAGPGSQEEEVGSTMGEGGFGSKKEARLLGRADSRIFGRDLVKVPPGFEPGSQDSES